MKESKEFRIGNYLEIDGRFEMVSSIHSDNTIRLRESENSPCHGCYSIRNTNIKPIQLTKDWILKFGFEENFKQYELQNYGLKVVKDVNSNVWICYIGFLNQFYEICTIKHVHELQNLYFALTGTELELKDEI